MVMSRDQNAGRSHNIKSDNISFERVEHLKYLGTILTNQNSIQKEIQSRLKSRNVCYHLVRNFLSSILISKNVKIKIYRTVIQPVVLYGCETWWHTLREGHRRRVNFMATPCINNIQNFNFQTDAHIFNPQATNVIYIWSSQ